MNKADNAAGTKAVDSLINYETVKVGKLKLSLKFFYCVTQKTDNNKPIK